MKGNPAKKENMWNAILNEQSNLKRHANKNLLLLGRKNAGKRSLIDSLTDVSKTLYPKKNNQDIMAGKMRVKGAAALLDYTYLNVLDLNDPDNQTNARINVYLFEEDFQRNLLINVLNEKSLGSTIVGMVLDLQEPWTFMDDLNKWIDILTDAMGKVKVNMKVMDQMRDQVTNYTRSFKEVEEKEPESSHRLDDDQVVQLPLREGILKINLGVPLMVIVTKSDILEQAEKDKDWDAKFEVILFSLRQFCLTYGATLIFTSTKSATNLNVFYEYMLHRLYEAPLRHRSDLQNGESLFIPIGIEDAAILKSLYTKFSGDLNYEEKVPMLTGKKQVREELVVEDNQELFKKLREKQGTSGTSSKQGLQLNLGQIQEKSDVDAPLSQRQLITPGGQNKQTEQLQNFYSKILQPQGKLDSNQLRDSAKEDLFNKLKGKTDTSFTQPKQNVFNADEKARIQNIIKMPQQPESTKTSNDKVANLLNFTSLKKNEDTDAKLKNLLLLTNKEAQN